MAAAGLGKVGQRVLLTCMLFPFAAAVLVRAAGSSPRPMAAAPERPGLAFSQYLVDLGEPSPSEQVTAYFAFRNTGKSPVRITELVPSCGCLKPQLEKMEYEPGEPGDFKLRVQTANQDPGAKEYWVTVKYEDPQPREATVTFRVKLPEDQVFVKPRALAFYQLSNQPTTQTVTVVDLRIKPLQITGVRCTNPLVSVALGKEVFDEDGRPQMQILVTAPAKLPEPRINATVFITTDDPDYKQLRVPLIIQGPGARTAAMPRGPVMRTSTN